MELDPRTISFLTHLNRGGTWSFFWKPDTPRGRITHWYKSAGQIPTPRARDNVYFGINPCRYIPPKNSEGRSAPPYYVRSQITYLQCMNTYYAEFDATQFNNSLRAAHEHIQQLSIPPSVLVCSGGGYHGYWLLDKPYIFTKQNKGQARIRQWAFVEWAGGDPGAKCLTRHLRMPGTLNTKYDPARTVTFEKYDLAQTLDISTINRLTQPIYDRIMKDRTKQNRYVGNTGPLVKGMRLKQIVEKRVIAILDKAARAKQGNRNSLLFWAACRMGELAAADWTEISREDAYRLLFNASPLEKGETTTTIASGLDKGTKTPAKQPRYQMREEPHAY